MASARREVAAYWHLEDLIVTEYDRIHTPGSWLQDGVAADVAIPHGLGDRVGQARINVPEIGKFVRSIGHAIVTRMYADWSREAISSYRPTIAKILPRNLSQVISGPAGLDVGLRVAKDVVRDLQLHVSVTDVVIIAGSADFDGLAQLCDRGVQLHAIGVASASNERWQESCRFTPYGDLVPTLPDAAPPPWAAPLVAVLRGSHEHRCLLKELKENIRLQDPGFDESTWMCGSMAALVNMAAASGHVVTEDDERGRWVRLPGETVS